MFASLMRCGFQHNRPGEPITHRTILGWVLIEELTEVNSTDSMEPSSNQFPYNSED